MPAGQAFAFQGFVVDRCAAAGAALLWLLPLGLVAFSGALGSLQGFFGSALLQWGGAHWFGSIGFMNTSQWVMPFRPLTWP